VQFSGIQLYRGVGRYQNPGNWDLATPNRTLGLESLVKKPLYNPLIMEAFLGVHFENMLDIMASRVKISPSLGSVALRIGSEKSLLKLDTCLYEIY